MYASLVARVAETFDRVLANAGAAKTLGEFRLPPELRYGGLAGVENPK